MMPETTRMPVKLSQVRPRFDAEPVARRIGLILLATDHTTERDFNRMVPQDKAGVYGARIEYANPTTPENLRKMAPRLSAGTALLLPDEKLDAVVFSCTSASVEIGDAVAAAIGTAKPGTPVVTPVSAARDALHVLKARRISILTPYTLETSQPMAEYFARLGFDVINLDCFGLEDDRQMARIAPDSLVEAAAATVRKEADALFISCTALRSAEVAGKIETLIGRPVVTSNQASVWRALRHCCIDDAIEGYGRLLALAAPEGHPA